MPSTRDGNGFDDSAEDYGVELLPPDESLDSDEIGDEIDETGYSPLDRPSADLAWGFTPREARSREPLSARLSREIPENIEDDLGDGIGDATDTDGEVIDDQVGSVRAGRLTWAALEDADSSTDYWANDNGIDGAGASAEEAAVHIVLADGDLF